MPIAQSTLLGGGTTDTLLKVRLLDHPMSADTCDSDQKTVLERVKAHFALAEGSPVQRRFIAVTMIEIEDEMVEREQARMTKAPPVG